METDPNISKAPAEDSFGPPADSSLEISGEGSLETSGKNPLNPSAVSSPETPGESRTMQIPVGTEVITMLGAVTTFSRLDADDTVAIVLEGDDIIRIYIIR